VGREKGGWGLRVNFIPLASRASNTGKRHFVSCKEGNNVNFNYVIQNEET